MEPAAGDDESGVLHAAGASEHQRTGREPDNRAGHRCNYNRHTVALAVAAVIILILFIVVIAQAVSSSGCSPTVQGPACPDDWVGYRGKCYYFSKVEKNWTDSQSNCSALGASLASIDTLKELDFMLLHKGKLDYWIGLRRGLGQPWKWVNGTEFNNLFPITGDGDCAYLNDNRISSLRCISERRWVCSKADVFTEEVAMKGDISLRHKRTTGGLLPPSSVNKKYRRSLFPGKRSLKPPFLKQSSSSYPNFQFAWSWEKRQRESTENNGALFLLGNFGT